MDYSFSEQTKHFKSSAVRDILSVIQQGNVISFAGGLPSDDFFPIEAVQSAYEKVFASGRSSLQYGLTEGFTPLREVLQTVMTNKGITSTVEKTLLTTGSQQVIDLFSRIMLAEGDVVLTEDPTYLAALQVFRSYGAKVIAVKGDENGMDPHDLEEKMRVYQPKFVYVVPTFSNPEAKIWSAERRQKLVELCYQYHVLTLEDDPYGELNFTNDTFEPIASFDEKGSHILYTSTFSKTVVPGLRTGWVTGPDEVIAMMSQAKQMTDLHSSSIDQQALYYIMRDFDLQRHIETLRKEYYVRMTIMRDYLNKLDRGLFKWKEPKGGMFMWIEGDEELDATSLLGEAVKNGVAYVPGTPFYVNEPKLNTFRLNFSHSTPDNIKLGMDRLVSVLTRQVTV
ncbi:PLP-dependent aminotransferase family protein [Robertmurraya sp. DFI.2.37]|uniref:aminotransferase-like domain-containing protein n=1 Tax=Robertmurraya sp. DFI.2.37 TaxID=3031819 RepID=UPI0012494182|nr:PLP-dependent aminotransferase family protein [Robertmurraya sp. DFI.2.37]MDF1509132.1 PLP-dependent aminotransferase family protein [Robertmurraya sp. DFI.2.37]